MDKISIIIPTYNRPDFFQKTLDSLLWQTVFPYEIIVVDQSDTPKIQHICNNPLYTDLSIRYFHTNIASWALARNLAIDHLSQETDIVVFLDDDVSLAQDFLAQILYFFQHTPFAKWGVASIQKPYRKLSLSKKIGFFLLTWHVAQPKAFITKWWYNIIPTSSPTRLTSVEWTHGCGMFFRKSLLDEWFRFEHRFMKYSLMEDAFFSYKIHQKYPNSLYFVPTVHMIHHKTPTARITTQERVFQEIVHRYLFVQMFAWSEFVYLWTMMVLCAFDILVYRKIALLLWYIQGISYVFSHRKNILRPDFDFNTFIFKKN